MPFILATDDCTNITKSVKKVLLNVQNEWAKEGGKGSNDFLDRVKKVNW